jgi:hypothetical protein
MYVRVPLSAAPRSCHPHLHTVQALPCVTQLVASMLLQHVGFRQAPQLEHVCADLPPQHQRLQHIMVLPAQGSRHREHDRPGQSMQRSSVLETICGEDTRK